ncbi:RNA polymerase sigma-70 factor [Flavobacteriaceae bacterium F08102]|nr:RNA polymerase sigma-70 factor [Flavobacteriaceae bacterium F08102]
MSVDEERILLQRLSQNDQDALTSLYTTYWEALYISAFNLLKNKEACEEIVQDVFCNIWRNRATLKIAVSLKSYLFTAVRYQTFSQIRKNKKVQHIELFEHLDNRMHTTYPETDLIFEEFVEHVNSIVATLPKKCRKVYQLSRSESLTHKEIADRLEISTKTVENHISKALKTLRLALGMLSLLLTFLFL